VRHESRGSQGKGTKKGDVGFAFNLIVLDWSGAKKQRAVPGEGLSWILNLEPKIRGQYQQRSRYGGITDSQPTN
jgi:hypothetical protein